jgi:trimeric autotransporter adhesin
MIRTITTYRSRPLAKGTALLLSASAMALASIPAQAADVLFSSTGQTQVAPGQRTVLDTGVLQLRLDNGATLSFTQGAEFTLNADGTLDLHKGSVTVAGAGDGQTLVRMPEGVEGRVGGTGNAASFTVRDDGESNGHTLTGTSTITRGRTSRDFAEGQMWESSGRSGIRRVLARASQETPAAAPAAIPAAQEAPVEVADLREGGPVAAAQNGLPVSLGDGLAAAGASADLVMLGRRLDVANGNPALDSYPAGDLARLVALAAGLESWNGGQPFPAAQADVIRTYLRFLANGGAGAQFVTAYAGFLTQYLDLIRAGGTPSQFGAASQADINAFLAYQSRLGRLGQLSAQNRALAEAYLAFVRGGGNPDLFAAQYTDLVEAYFAFVRGGGNPLEFAGASQEVLDAYIAFLGSSGLSRQLSLADQEILAAYLESGGFAFAATYAEALQAYFAYLQSGGLPSAAEGLTTQQLRAYLELLDASGLFAQLLDEQAPFYAAYLAFLQGGGDPDDFGQLNANIFAGYATQLNAYFAFLQGGGLPSAFAGDPDLLAQYLAALDNAEALEAFLGANAGFFAQYLAFLQGGGEIDVWTGLNANIFAGYAQALDAYFTFLAQGGLPSQYQELTQEQIAAYVAALQAQGATGAFLAGLADFYTGYLAYLQGGGDPDLFTGLPTLNLPAFADALNAYAAFLAGGGLPGDYDAASLSLLAIYLDALGRSGQLTALLGGNADLLDAFFAFLAGGGNADLFSGLPLYATYASALQAYFAFLDAGGLPGDYTALTPQQIQSYLAALSAAGGFASQLGTLADFYTAYFAYLSTGGNPNGFSGLPIYAGYVSALNAYFAFLDGGGLPGDYTALTAQQIADYLAALNGAGGFAAFGTLNAFFADYFAFISGGGNPAAYVGLPLYADYVSALNTYFAFLAAGGLPGDYTALTPAQIEAYLDALAGVQGGFGSFAGLNAFFAQYYAFIQGGGDPDDFTGLPVYADYLAAVQAFYAFLAGGGVPSGYTALTAEQIEAYLAILDALGLLAANFDGDVLDFYTSYLAFLAGGGVPDDFGGLPDGIDNQLTGANAWVFGTDGLRINTAANADVQDDGRITRVVLQSTSGNQTFDYSARTADLREHGRAGNAVAWSRYYTGTAAGAPNVSEHLLVGDPAINHPASGTVTYQLIGGTAPTDRRDTAGSTGYFTGALAVAFGATPLVGLNFDVVSGTEGYRVQTTGGATNPQSGGMAVNQNGLFENQNLGFTRLTDTTCLSFCQAQVFGGLFGDGATHAGFTYNIFDQTANNAIQGVAVFGTSGTALAGLGTMPVQSDVTLQNQSFAYANKLIGDDIYTDIEVTYNADGIPVAYNAFADEMLDSGTTTLADQGSAGNGAISWARWSNGTPAGNWYNTTLLPVGPNGGYHVIAGADLTNMPTTGTVEYDLIGFTTPTRHDESTSTGSVSGGAAVVFGAAPVVALDLTVTSGADVFALFTAGKLANPDQSTLRLLPDGMFHTLGSSAFGPASSGAITVQSASPFCAGTNGCAGFVEGFLAGDGGSHLGLAYSIRDNRIPNKFIDGTAAFAKGDAIDLGGGALGSNIYGVVQAPDTLDIFVGTGVIANDGVITSLTPNGSSVINPQAGATEGEFGRFADTVAFTRYFESDSFYTNRVRDFLAGTPATNLPASGTVNYVLLGGSAPADNLGSDNSIGFLTNGALAVSFGATSRVGLEFDVYVDDLGWHVQTTGGAANPGNGGLAINSFNAFGGRVVTTNLAGNACTPTCNTDINGSLFGAGASHAGFTYLINEFRADQSIVTGTAIFGASGTEVASIGTDPRGGGGGGGGGAYTSDFTGTRSGQVFYTYTNGSLALGFGGEATLANGGLTGVSAAVIGGVSSGTTQIVEAGDVGHMAWARWTNGSVTNANIFGSAPTVIGANGGYHVMAGTAPSSLSASGTINYDLIATTSATDSLGSTPGTVSGDMAIQFGTTIKVGYDMQMAVGGRSWAVSTTGGAANPSTSLVNVTGGLAAPAFGGTFNSNLATVTAGGNACQSGCSVSISGALYGPNGGYAGVAMNVLDIGTAGAVTATGMAIFQAEGATPAGGGASGPAFAAIDSATADWDRWDVGSTTAIAQGNGMVATAPGLDQLAGMGVQFSAEQMVQLDAWMAAQRVN